MRIPALLMIKLLYYSLFQTVVGQRGFPGGGFPGGGFPDYGGGGTQNNCGTTQITVPSSGNVHNMSSPDWPFHYPSSLNCRYQIYTSSGRKIFMYIAYFQIEPQYDTLTIGKDSDSYDERTALVQLTGTFVRLKRLWTPGHSAWMHFETDQTKTLQGFVISLKMVYKTGVCVGDREVRCDNGNCIDFRGRCNGQNDCGDNSDESALTCSRCPADNAITLPETGTRKLIWTPGYPNRYPSSVKCFWYINSTTPDSRISAYVEDFKLEESYDWWTAGYGDNIKDSESLLIKLSGELAITRIMSPVNLMWIGFKSDDRINKAGFWIYVQSISGKDNCTDYGNYFQCDNDYCVKSAVTCNGYNDCLDNSDETKCETINCGDERYWCRGDPYCISVDNICDGIQHCSQNHDELNCDQQKCPDGCMCHYRSEILDDFEEHPFLVVNCSTGWDLGEFTRYPQQIDTMVLSNADIPTLPSTATFRNFTLLRYLSLVSNQISKIEGGAFINLISVTWLDLSRNLLSRIESGAFIGLSNLEILLMYETPLIYVDTKGLNGLNSLQAWFLHRDLPKTHSVDLAGFTYDTRTGYTYGDSVYSGIQGLENLYVDDYRLCCYMRFIKAKQCSSTTKIPQFFDCRDLVKHDAIKICLWLINLVGIVANILLIEIRNRNYNRIGRLCVPSFLFGNLAVSGVFMGVYSLMMGFIDLSNENGGDFFVNSDKWRESIKCKAAGAVAIIAIQSLIFILTAISIERYIKVMHPNSKFVMSVRAAKVTMIGCWTLAVVLGVSIPLLAGSEVYGTSDTCIGLPLHRLFNQFEDVMIDFKSPAGGFDVVIPTAVLPHKTAWPLSISLFLILDPLCLLGGLSLFLIVKFKGIQEELPVDEDDNDDDDDFKKSPLKPVVIDVGKKDGSITPSTAPIDVNDGGDGLRALPNPYEDPSAPPHEYETLDEVKQADDGKKEKESDDDDDEVVGTAAVDVPKFIPKDEAMSRKMTKRKGTGRRVKVLKGSKPRNRSLKKKKSTVPEGQIATVTDGVIFSPDDPVIIDEMGGKSFGEGGVTKEKFLTLEGADMIMSKEDLEVGLEQGERRKKKSKRRRKKKVEKGEVGKDLDLEDENGHTNMGMSDAKSGEQEHGDNEEKGDNKTTDSETDTSDSDESSDDDIEIEIEERRITSKNLASKMMRLFIFDLSTLSIIFIVGILAQTGAIDMPIEFTYWAALFLIPFLFCMNPFVICCVDIGGIRPKYEWQFDEVSYSETLSEKRERVAREAMTFL